MTVMLASAGTVAIRLVGALVMLGFVGAMVAATRRWRWARPSSGMPSPSWHAATATPVARPRRRYTFDLGRGLAFSGLGFLVLPFLPLLVLGIVQTTRGDHQTTLLPGALGSAACLTAILATPWRRVIGAVLLHMVSPWRWRRLSQVIVAAALVAAAVAAPFVIRGAQAQARSDRIQRAHLETAFAVATRSGTLPRSTASAIAMLSRARPTTSLMPTPSAADTGEVSVAVGAAGSQLVLVANSHGVCFGLVDNRGSVPGGAPNAPSAAGIWHASWSPDLHYHNGCWAAALPTPNGSGEIGLFHQDTWAQGSFQP